VEEKSVNPPTPSGYAIDRICTFGFALAVGAVAVQTVAHLTNALVFDYEFWDLDADQDGNALSWASSTATAGAALGALGLGMFRGTPSLRLIVLATLLAFFSLDDVAAIHEELASAAASQLDVGQTFAHALWPGLYLPLLGFVVLTLWRLSQQAQGRVRRAIVLGLALLAVAVVAEVASAMWWEEDARPLIDDLGVAVEEGAELGGWILIATGLMALACLRLLRLGPGSDLLSEADRNGPAR
jgi:hypothetical protein